MRGLVKLAALAAVSSLLASPAVAQPPEKSLVLCEKAIGKQATKYASAVQKTVGGCLNKIAQETIQYGDPIADAAKTCARGLRKIENSENAAKTLSAKFGSLVTRPCDPTAEETKATFTAPQALDPNDPNGIQAGLLGSYCGAFGGDGSVDDVAEWVACVDEAVVCSALQQIAVEYPRASEWLGGIASAITAIDPNQPRYTDAASAASAIQAQIDSDMDGTADILCGPIPVDDGPVLPATGQTASDGPGSDGDVQAGVARSFTDNGDGTITDNATGLMWEKKSDDGSIHDVDRSYSYCIQAGCAQNGMNGTVVTLFLANLNAGGGFAGYTDWRVPNINELASLRNIGTTNPITYSEFNTGCTPGCSVTACSCTAADNYLSSSTYLSGVISLFVQNFNNGIVGAGSKQNGYRVRAVRGGLQSRSRAPFRMARRELGVRVSAALSAAEARRPAG